MHVKINGKNKRVPDKEVETLMKVLEVSKEEAIQIWMEDEGYEINAEQEALNDKAADYKIQHDAHASSSGKERKVKGPREDKRKQEIIAEIASHLSNCYGEKANVTIENIGKIITFEIEGEKFKLDLVKRRTK